MTRVDSPIYQITLRTSDLEKLSEAQRRVLLMLGHAANEVSAFYRAAHAAAMDADSKVEPVTRQIARSQTLLMLRTAASKAYELFVLTERNQDYSLIINTAYEDFSTIRKDVKRILSAHVPLKTLRNKFGFHYNKEIYEDIDTLHLIDDSNEETHAIYFEQKSVNTFFAISEFFFQKTFAAAMRAKPGYDEFATKAIFSMVGDFMVAFNKFVTAIHNVIIGICRAAGVDLNAPERRTETSAPFILARDARLPALLFFRDHKEALALEP